MSASRELKDVTVKLRVSPSQLVLLKAAAKADHLELSTWIRQTALRKATAK